MKNQTFIPSNVEPLDSDDDSSIHGDLVTGIAVIGEVSDEELGSVEASNAAAESDAAHSESVDAEIESEDLTDSSDSDSSDTDDCDETTDDEASKLTEVQNPGTSGTSDGKDAVAECDDDSSEEISATMEEIFNVKPNPEAQRNHPPNFKTNISILDLCFHPEAEMLAAATIDGECIVYRYNMEKVEEVTRFSHHKTSCRQLCYNVDGSILYTASKDKSLAVVDTKNSCLKHHFENAHDSPIYSFFEIDENMVTTGDDDGLVKLWDLRKGKSVFEFKCSEETITSLLCCEANRYLSATSADGSLTGINIRRKRMEAQSEMFDSEFTCQALLRSETRLAVGTGSGIVSIFKWGDFGYQIDAMGGHPDLIHCMAPITDKIILTGCEDGNIRAVHLYEHKFLGVVGQHKDFGVENLAISCDGSILASCSLDDEIQFWNISYLYDKINFKRKSSKQTAVQRNLPSSRKRNKTDFFQDFPRKMESDDDGGGPVPGTSFDSD